MTYGCQKTKQCSIFISDVDLVIKKKMSRGKEALWGDEPLIRTRMEKIAMLNMEFVVPPYQKYF